MTYWIILVVIAQFINAIVSLIDKYIVSSRRVGDPVKLTFYISVLSSLSVVLFLFSWVPIPFLGFDLPQFANISMPSVQIVVLSCIAAVSFIGGLITLFKSFQFADASDVVPVVSSTNAVVTLLLSFYILNTTIPHNFLWGVLFLAVGMFLVGRFRFNKKLISYTLASGVLFAVHYIVLKVLFDVTHFDDAFFWSRIGISVVALFLLFSPVFYVHKKKSLSHTEQEKRGGYWLVIGNKIIAGIASILLLKAISLGDVAVVQALAGIQFLFLLCFSLFLGNKTSIHFGENVTRADRVQKIISIAIIITGFSLLFI